jgi:hypothetical protein
MKWPNTICLSTSISAFTMHFKPLVMNLVSCNSITPTYTSHSITFLLTTVQLLSLASLVAICKHLVNLVDGHFLGIMY